MCRSRSLAFKLHEGYLKYTFSPLIPLSLTHSRTTYNALIYIEDFAFNINKNIIFARKQLSRSVEIFNDMKFCWFEFLIKADLRWIGNEKKNKW